MVATGSPAPTTTGSRIDVTREEFERRLAGGGHSADEIGRLWQELAAPASTTPPPARPLGLGPVIAVYLGLLLVVAASVSLLAIYWDDLGAWGVLALAAAYLGVYVIAGETLRRRRLTQPADVLEAVAVGWVGLATYAAQELAGRWPGGVSGGGEIHRGLTVVAIAVLVAALVLLALRPDPLLLVPAAAATALLAGDLAELAFGARLDDLSGREVAAFLLPLGLAWIATGLWLDVLRLRAFATWAHWCGLLLSGVALLAAVPKTVPGFALIGVLGAISLFFSALVRHWSFTVIGAAGVLTATASALGLLGGIAPAVIAVVGIALVFVGLRWSSRRESVRIAVLARMPEGARDVVQRLAP